MGNDLSRVLAAVAPRRVAVADARNGVDLLDGASGATLRRATHLFHVAALAGDGRGHVFAAGDAELDTLDARTGATLHVTDLNPDMVGTQPFGTLAVDARAERVYLMVGTPIGRGPDNSAAIAVVDVASGVLLRTVPLHDTVGGGHTGELALDASAGRVLGVTINGLTILDTTHL